MENSIKVVATYEGEEDKSFRICCWNQGEGEFYTLESSSDGGVYW